MRFLGRALLFLFGLLLAITAGLLALVVGIAVEPAARELIAALGAAGFDDILSDLWEGDTPELAPGGLLIRLWAVSATLLVLPPALVALIGEIAGARSFVWYGFGCGALTAALPWLSRGSKPSVGGDVLVAEGRITAVLFVAGAAAGLTYWLVAGRSAGSRE